MLQDEQRHGPATQHLVEGGEVKAHTGARARLITHPLPFRVADLVAAGLSRPDAVAVDLALRPPSRLAGHAYQIIGRLLAAPALRVQTRIDHQSRRTELHRLQITDAAERMVIVCPKL